MQGLQIAGQGTRNLASHSSGYQLSVQVCPSSAPLLILSFMFFTPVLKLVILLVGVKHFLNCYCWFVDSQVEVLCCWDYVCARIPSLYEYHIPVMRVVWLIYQVLYESSHRVLFVLRGNSLLFYKRFAWILQIMIFFQGTWVIIADLCLRAASPKGYALGHAETAILPCVPRMIVFIT